MIVNTFNVICERTGFFHLVLMSMNADIGVGIATRWIFVLTERGEKNEAD